MQDQRVLRTVTTVDECPVGTLRPRGLSVPTLLDMALPGLLRGLSGATSSSMGSPAVSGERGTSTRRACSPRHRRSPYYEERASVRTGGQGESDVHRGGGARAMV